MRQGWSLGTKLGLQMAAMVVLFSALLTVAQNLQFRRQLRADLRDQLADLLQIVAARLDASTHDALQARADEPSPAYARARRQLQDIRDLNPDFRFVYTLRQRPDGQVAFVVDAETHAADLSHIGDIYAHPTPEMGASFTSGTPVVEHEFSRDSWGVQLSGYVPLHRHASGAPVVLGIDVSPRRLLSRERDLLLVSLALFGLSIPMALLIGFWTGRRFNRPLQAMIRGADRVAHGDYNFSLMINRSDEIGRLGENFNLMTHNLRREMQVRGKAERSLRESDTRNRLLFESIPAGVLLIDAETHRILDVNPAGAQMIGLPRDSILGKECHQFICPAEKGACPISDLKQPIDNSERRLITAGGQMRDVLKTVVRVEVEGRAHLLESFVDISARKQAEDRLRRTAIELAQHNEAIRQFAYMASHDLRAPLVNIQGFTDQLRVALARLQPALLRGLPPAGTPERRDQEQALTRELPEAMTFLENAAARMNELITALVQWTQMGTRKLHPERVDAAALVRGVLEQESAWIQAHQARVNLDLLPQVTADPKALADVLAQILRNALHYIAPDRRPEVHVSAHREAHETVFSVWDNGRGIAAEDQGKVFAPFRRIGRPDQPGTGMGLAFAQALVHRMGGRIWFESSPETGSAFHFSVPDEPPA